MIILDILVHGAASGALLALLSLGFSLIFGVGRIVNFAHGAFYMIAGYFAYTLLTSLRLSPTLSVALSILLVSLLGIAAYRLVISPVRGSQTAELTVTLALATLAQEVIRHTYGPQPLGLPSIIQGNITVFGVTLDGQRGLIILASASFILGLWLFISRARLGKAIRAVAQDLEVAVLMGIEPEKITMLAMGVAALSAASAGALIAPVITVSMESGWLALTSAIAVTILGGLGSFWGTLLAAFIISYSEILVAVFLASHLKTAVALITIVVVLLIRPSGLLGKQYKLEAKA